MDKIPSLSFELIKALEKDIPRVVIMPGMTQDALMYNAGKRAVVDSLLAKLLQQKEEMSDEQEKYIRERLED